MMVAANTPVRKFVPRELEASDFSRLEPLYRSLLDRRIASAAELERWLDDLSELSAVVDEFGSRKYIDKSCHTDDKQIEAAYMNFVENVEPKIKPIFFELQKRLLQSPFAKELRGQRYEMLMKKWRVDVELFRDENVPIETQITKTVTEYDKICGEMMVNFQGKDYTLQQMQKFIEKPDRPLRQEAWELVAKRRLRDREKVEDLFEQLLPMREKVARNAGLSDFRAYVWKSYKRFDYTPEDCLKFADTISRVCVPLMKELDEQRRGDLGLPKLRPWDLAVDPKNRPPLAPFADSEVENFIDKTKAIFDRLSPELAKDFETLRRNRNLDLQSRKGKQPGGYQMSLEETKTPFIFMNAAGLQRDVEVLLHEGGHAFHHIAACATEPLVFLRSAPMEFCEVASMSMELLGMDHFDIFYDESADSARAKRTMLEGIIKFFPWMATIDVFQHWLYTHPGHTREQRKQQWLELMKRFGRDIDWTGYEATRESSWQAQLHLFHVPFYYVEYGIAQLGALQIWQKSKQNGRQALADYRNALKLGGTRPLPELFKTAGIRFDFSEQTIRPLMDAIRRELAELPR
jgi:oligoendopeptidase F